MPKIRHLPTEATVIATSDAETMVSSIQHISSQYPLSKMPIPTSNAATPVQCETSARIKTLETKKQFISGMKTSETVKVFILQVTEPNT